MTKLFSLDVQSISIGSCNHPMVGGVIDACTKCEPALRRRGFVAYRGQTRPEPETVEEVIPASVENEAEVSTTVSEEVLSDG